VKDIDQITMLSAKSVVWLSGVGTLLSLALCPWDMSRALAQDTTGHLQTVVQEQASLIQQLQARMDTNEISIQLLQNKVDRIASQESSLQSP
jgi:hypothetical protein